MAEIILDVDALLAVHGRTCPICRRYWAYSACKDFPASDWLAVRGDTVRLHGTFDSSISDALVKRAFQIDLDNRLYGFYAIYAQTGERIDPASLRPARVEFGRTVR